MAAVTFDTLKCARRLMAAGMSEELAAAQAEVMAEAFVMNVDNLVTKDYLEVSLKALEDRLAARLDDHESRFDLIDSRFDQVDQRFNKVDARFDRIDARFDAIDRQFNRIDDRFHNNEMEFRGLDARFAEIAGNFRLMFWILAAISATTVIPALHKLFSGAMFG